MLCDFTSALCRKLKMRSDSNSFPLLKKKFRREISSPHLLAACFQKATNTIGGVTKGGLLPAWPAQFVIVCQGLGQSVYINLYGKRVKWVLQQTF